MSLVPSTVEQAPVAERPRGHAVPWARWLVVCCYLLGAVVVTWRLWADPAAHVQVGDKADVNLFAWFMRYEATAVAHGRLPALVTTAMNAPRGIGLMWNTSLLLPGVLLAPVTLLAGPQTTLTVVLTLGFAGSAASLFLVLRRWGASVTAAALGGAVYGFSPALLNSGIGHYHMQFAVLPPLIIDALLRVVTGRGRTVRTGAWLGVLTAAQLFTGEELLVETAVAGLILVAVLAAGRPRAVMGRARAAAAGLATGAGVMLLLCGRALWVQFRGPLSQHGSPWATGSFYAHPAVFVTPPGSLLFHTSASAAAAASAATSLTEYLGYLGWPLLAVLAVAAIVYWRDPKVRAAAVTFALLELFTLGGHARYLPWHWLQGLPVLSQALPDRFAILADGAAAAVLAFSLDLARSAARQSSAAPQSSAWRRGNLATAVAVLAVLPLIPLPYQEAPAAPVPAGWQAAFARLRLAPDAPVLLVPVPYGGNTDALRWQADTGEPGSLNEGYFIGPTRSGQAAQYGTGVVRQTARYLDLLWKGYRHVRAPSRTQIRADLAYWHPAAVVAVATRGSRLRRILISLFGPPAFQIGRMLAWRR